MAGIINTSNGPTKPYVDGKVQSEEDRAKRAERALQEAISAEQSRAEDEEALIRGEIQTATDRAESAESALSTAISTEQSRAEAAEQNIRSDLQSEIDRATTAESNLSSAIDAEESRAQNSEQAIVQSIDNLVGVNNGAGITLGTISQEVLDQANDYTDNQISERIATVYTVKGSCTYSDLPTTGQGVGDVWNVTTPNTDGQGNAYTQGDPEYVPPGTNYVWTGTEWDAMGGTIDLSPYEFTNDVNAKLNTFTNTTDLNTVLRNHQNRIMKRQVSITSSDSVDDSAGVAKSVDGVTGASTEILLVSPTVASSNYATDIGLRAIDAGNGTITFKADAAYPSGVSNITFDITIIDTNTGVEVQQQQNYPISNS